MDGKTANGLVRSSQTYRIVGIIDSERAGLDSGEILENKKNGIPIYGDLSEAVGAQPISPKYFIYGMAPLSGFLEEQEKNVVFQAMENGMDIVIGLHEFLTDDERFVNKAKECNVTIFDIRKPKSKKDLSVFTGRIVDVSCPKIVVLGTDSAIGKRTTATILTNALNDAGLKAIMIATGQTGIIQGEKFGVALDAIPGQFISGEMESAVVEAFEIGKPDVIIIEGQGALSHPAYLSSCYIVRGSQPDAIILQHVPGRKMLGDYPDLPMPTIESEINLVETFSRSPVIAITINPENMTVRDVDEAILEYESKFNVAATDALARGCDDLIEKILTTFPDLAGKVGETIDDNAASGD